jgi:hydroxymethylglutaryl-CoA lyase
VLPTERKLALLRGLIDAGVRRIQVASFVHPVRVPQMADAEALCAGLPPAPGVIYSGLALNRRGVERAAAAGLTHVDASLSASDPHSRRNSGMGLVEARDKLMDTIAEAQRLGLRVRGGVQCAFGCDDGPVPLERVVELARAIAGQGVVELALADSTGVADPLQMERVLEAVTREVLEPAGHLPLVLHLHDTRGLGLANVLTALQHGVTRFDTAFGGLGGCPFIRGATGNVATEDTVHLLDALGVASGVDLEGVAAVSAAAERWLRGDGAGADASEGTDDTGEGAGADGDGGADGAPDAQAESAEIRFPSKLYGLWKRAHAAPREEPHAPDRG